MNPFIDDKEVSISGKIFRSARLRHEGCDFFEDPSRAIEKMSQGRPIADLFTFVRDLCDPEIAYPFHKETASMAVLSITTYEKWWDDIGFKTRNKIRKGQKSGVELRLAELDNAFSQGVQAIYNETPIKQGRKFYHYGKSAVEIKDELGSFLDRSILVGAYFQGELVGFMKLFQGNNVLRTIHIIAKISHRDKSVMDALIAKGVELCDEKKIAHLHYGSWTDGGVGTFREKHGFRKFDVPRYFVPLSLKGRLMLLLKMHKPMRDRLPKSLIEPMIGLRTKWNSLRFRKSKVMAEG